MRRVAAWSILAAALLLVPFAVGCAIAGLIQRADQRRAYGRTMPRLSTVDMYFNTRGD